MKVLIVPDSFKGTMTSTEVCATAKQAILSINPDAEIKCIPVADGGEGSAEAFFEALQPSAEIIDVETTDLFGRPKTAKLCINGKTAFIEIAQSAGLDTDNPDVMNSGTYGVGQMIIKALDKKCDKLVFCLGGSGTNDMGLGAACALGAECFDKSGGKFIPKSGELQYVKAIDICGMDKRLEECEIIAACDVANPLFGADGAAYVYSPQKGATAAEAVILDNGLRHIAKLIKDTYGLDVSDTKGAGAAGGFGAGLMLFFGGKPTSGADTVLDVTSFDEYAEKADIIITGEGKTDGQTLKGKLISRIAARAQGKKLLCFCGAIGEGSEKLHDCGVSEIICINPPGTTFEDAVENCKRNLYNAVSEAFTDK